MTTGLSTTTPIRKRLFIVGLACAACIITGCREAPDASESGDEPIGRDARSGTEIFPFQDVTAESGIDMIMRSGEAPIREILEVNGGGIAVIDFNANGRPDLFVANGATLDDPENGPGSRLFRNDGAMRFTCVTASAGIHHTRWSFGVAVGDVDGDGHDDLFIGCYGANVLLRNRGDGTFQDISREAGLDDTRWATGAAFGDLDLDGTLDLYVVNYLIFDHEHLPARARYKGVTVMGGPHGLPASHDVLYRNDGNGRFTDVTRESGCLPQHPAYGLGVVILDFNQSGRQDIFVGNDSMANFLFLNQGDWTFRDDGVRSGIASNFDGNDQATMGIAIGDVTGNGRPDVFTTNFSSDTNTLHVQRDDGFFDDRTRSWGLGQISHAYLGWAAAFIDLDHDGLEDLVSFNGHVYPEATMATMDSEYEQRPLVFRRLADRFDRVESDDPNSWLNRRGRDRTAVFVDLDGNGAIDMVVGELNGPVRVLRNLHDGPLADRLIVNLTDERTPGNRRALGAMVTLETDAREGEHRQHRWIYSGGFQAAPPAEAHFGVPAGTTRGRVTVRWPDGEKSVRELGADDFGRRLTITR